MTHTSTTEEFHTTCPSCGSLDTEKDMYVDCDEVYVQTDCGECGAEWVDIFRHYDRTIIVGGAK